MNLKQAARQSDQGLTLLEALHIIALVVVLVGLTFPVSGPPKRVSLRMRAMFAVNSAFEECKQPFALF